MIRKFKYIVVLTMAVCLVFGIAACGESETSAGEGAIGQQTGFGTSEADIRESDVQRAEGNEPSETEPKTAGKDVLVAYFSATGTTKGVAERIAAITAADVYEIVPADPYSSADLDYNDSQSRTSVEMNDRDARPEIGSEMVSLDGYTTLYLGYPIWWGESPRIMSTFVETYDFDGITVIPFCTSGGSGIGESYAQLAEQAGSGTWISGRRFSGGVSESDLQAWIDELQ